MSNFNAGFSYELRNLYAINILLRTEIPAIYEAIKALLENLGYLRVHLNVNKLRIKLCIAYH